MSHSDGASARPPSTGVPSGQAATQVDSATLMHWLRLLWDLTPPLRLDSDTPYIERSAIHLPARPHWHQHRAAAAHATAHLVYSPMRFDGTGLGPTTRALVALLEDARIEALAVRELPGLARLWRPLHTASPALGAGLPGLMQRLARTLADPVYDDPHPWVRSGRSMFYLDASLGLLALRTPTEVVQSATQLADELPTTAAVRDAAAVWPLPAYRDDHRWMWVTATPPAGA